MHPSPYRIPLLSLTITKMQLTKHQNSRPQQTNKTLIHPKNDFRKCNTLTFKTYFKSSLYIQLAFKIFNLFSLKHAIFLRFSSLAVQLHNHGFFFRRQQIQFTNTIAPTFLFGCCENRFFSILQNWPKCRNTSQNRKRKDKISSRSLLCVLNFPQLQHLMRHTRETRLVSSIFVRCCASHQRKRRSRRNTKKKSRKVSVDDGVRTLAHSQLLSFARHFKVSDSIHGQISSTFKPLNTCTIPHLPPWGCWKTVIFGTSHHLTTPHTHAHTPPVSLCMGSFQSTTGKTRDVRPTGTSSRHRMNRKSWMRSVLGLIGSRLRERASMIIDDGDQRVNCSVGWWFGTISRKFHGLCKTIKPDKINL